MVVIRSLLPIVAQQLLRSRDFILLYIVLHYINGVLYALYNRNNTISLLIQFVLIRILRDEIAPSTGNNT